MIAQIVQYSTRRARGSSGPGGGVGRCRRTYENHHWYGAPKAFREFKIHDAQRAEKDATLHGNEMKFAEKKAAKQSVIKQRPLKKKQGLKKTAGGAEEGAGLQWPLYGGRGD